MACHESNMGVFSIRGGYIQKRWMVFREHPIVRNDDWGVARHDETDTPHILIKCPEYILKFHETGISTVGKIWHLAIIDYRAKERIKIVDRQPSCIEFLKGSDAKAAETNKMRDLRRMFVHPNQQPENRLHTYSHSVHE